MTHHCPFVRCYARIPGVACCAPPRITRWRPRRWAWPLAAAIVVWALAQVAVAWMLTRDDDRARIIGMECGPEISGKFVWHDVYGERMVNDNANLTWALCTIAKEPPGMHINIDRRPDGLAVRPDGFAVNTGIGLTDVVCPAVQP